MARKARVSKTETIATGWRIPEDIRREFTAWCDQGGRKYEKENGKALFLWIRAGGMFREITEQAIASSSRYGPDFWQELEEVIDGVVRELKRRRQDKGDSSR